MTDEVHPGDLLSALLDGELPTHEADQVEAHLRECAVCRHELQDVREARDVLRGLGTIDPPSWLDTVTEPSRPNRPLQVLVSVTASIVAVLLLASGVGPTAVSPEPDTAIDDHASTAAALGMTRDRDVTPSTAPTADLESVDAPLRRLPASLGDYRLVESFEAGEGVHLLYRSGELTLSVFQEAGRIDWDELPAGEGRRVRIAGRNAWQWDDPPSRGRVIVIDGDGIVLTVVADESSDTATAIAALLPGADDLGARARIERSLTRAVQLLAPG